MEKYRIWHKAHKKHYGVCQLNLDNDYYKNTFTDGTDVVYFDDNGKQQIASFSEVILEQYTNLDDKNGKPIYEGDIIEDYVSLQYVIVFSFSTGGYYARCKKDYFHKIEDLTAIIIVGNRHEVKN